MKHVLHEVVELCDPMSNTVSKTLIRDSEGWFVLMDIVEERPAVYYHEAYASPSMMGWRDSSKVIESEDETVDQGNKSDSDTESQSLSMDQTYSPRLNILRHQPEIQVSTECVEATVNSQKPIIDEATTPVVEQKQMSKSTEDRSTVQETPEEDIVNVFNGPTNTMDNQSLEAAVLSTSTELPTSHKADKEIDLPGPSLNSTVASEAQATQTVRSILSEFDRFGEYVMLHFPLSQALFKVGASIYLLFLVKVLRKIGMMFQNQPLAVGLGNLGLTVALLFLIRLHVPERVRVQVDQDPGICRRHLYLCGYLHLCFYYLADDIGHRGLRILLVNL
ncbi:hypothetical protein EV360DRAFT_77651 [Lentinula raphanica]|nr:hypothetical protein EV360DRAFT_77651 [Lentinula raphanica]